MISSRYSCRFGNEARDDLVITVDLDQSEIERAHQTNCPETVAKAMALKRAYREVPEGFKHHADGVLPVWMN
jgi:hypothetical protein